MKVIIFKGRPVEFKAMLNEIAAAKNFIARNPPIDMDVSTSTDPNDDKKTVLVRPKYADPPYSPVGLTITASLAPGGSFLRPIAEGPAAQELLDEIFSEIDALGLFYEPIARPIEELPFRGSLTDLYYFLEETKAHMPEGCDLSAKPIYDKSGMVRVSARVLDKGKNKLLTMSAQRTKPVVLRATIEKFNEDLGRAAWRVIGERAGREGFADRSQ